MNGCRPCTAWVSEPQTPVTLIRTSASCGPGSGRSTVSTVTRSRSATIRRIGFRAAHGWMSFDVDSIFGVAGAQDRRLNTPSRCATVLRDAGPRGSQVRARVDQVRVAGQRLPDRGGELDVQDRPDVDFGHAGPHRAGELVVRDPGRAVQHQRHRHRAGQLGDEGVVERGGPVGHGVRAAHGHGERVDAGGRHELGRLDRVGTHAGCVRPVLARRPRRARPRGRGRWRAPTPGPPGSPRRSCRSPASRRRTSPS